MSFEDRVRINYLKFLADSVDTWGSMNISRVNHTAASPITKELEPKRTNRTESTNGEAKSANPTHPVHPEHPVHPVHPTHPTHPTHPLDKPWPKAGTTPPPPPPPAAVEDPVSAEPVTETPLIESPKVEAGTAGQTSITDLIRTPETVEASGLNALA